MKAQFSVRCVQKQSHDYELTVFDKDGRVNIRLIFDVRNRVVVVRKCSWTKGRNELAIYDDFVTFTEW